MDIDAKQKHSGLVDEVDKIRMRYHYIREFMLTGSAEDVKKKYPEFQPEWLSMWKFEDPDSFDSFCNEATTEVEIQHKLGLLRVLNKAVEQMEAVLDRGEAVKGEDGKTRYLPLKATVLNQIVRTTSGYLRSANRTPTAPISPEKRAERLRELAKADQAKAEKKALN